ncbi:MAG TPA: hypothetical protein VNW24_13465 [Stellaceae bacterium]|jgi:hypothetical protein|nr:hypothetical protein [Stellaceae bacterium]
MANHTLTKAYKAWLEALQNMRSALTANPLVADPLMASAQVFEDVGRMMFGAADQLKKRSRKRAKPKRTSARKKPTARPRRRARKS